MGSRLAHIVYALRMKTSPSANAANKKIIYVTLSHHRDEKNFKSKNGN